MTTFSAPTEGGIVVLESVFARDTAAPRGRSRGTLAGVNVSLGASVYAFVGAPEDGTLALTEVLTGKRSPLRGRALVSGLSPARSSETRKRIGSLWAEPSLPEARHVDAAVRIALEARGDASTGATAVLEPLGLGHLASREPRSLSYAETRAVELALALATQSPLLVVLYEPLSDVAINLLGLVRERIREIARGGACVVVMTSSPADARALADRTLVLHKGLILGEADAAEPLPGGEPAVIAWVRPAEGDATLAPVRVLSRLLAERPEVRAVSWSEGPAGSPRTAELRVVGDDLDACALALVDAATEASVVIEAIAPASAGITQVRAATEALVAMRRLSPRSRPIARPVAPMAAPVTAPIVPVLQDKPIEPPVIEGSSDEPRGEA